LVDLARQHLRLVTNRIAIVVEGTDVQVNSGVR
jgi:hypothetical protein